MSTPGSTPSFIQFHLLLRAKPDILGAVGQVLQQLRHRHFSALRLVSNARRQDDVLAEEVLHNEQRKSFWCPRVYSEFGRRIKDNGAGCNHGSGGVAFVIGESVNGGFYGELPSLREEDQLDGDLHFNNDFRSTYSTILDKWLGLDPDPIANGRFEQFDFILS